MRTPRTLKEAESGYLTPHQLAVLFQVQERTVLTWLRDGKVSGIKIGKVWRIPKSYLDGIRETIETARKGLVEASHDGSTRRAG